jgi:hypothetical protein
MTDETAHLRQALARQLIAALAADFDRKGKEAVERLREKDPSAYLRAVMAATADTPSTETPWSAFTDAKLAAALAAVENALSLTRSALGGAGAAPEREQAGALPPLPETESVS